MQNPAFAVKEMKRCVKELKFPGVQIGSHINDWNLDAEELACFWEVFHEMVFLLFKQIFKKQLNNQISFRIYNVSNEEGFVVW